MSTELKKVVQVTGTPAEGNMLVFEAGFWKPVIDSIKPPEYLSANRTLVAGDHGKVFLVTAEGITIAPPLSVPIGWYIKIWTNNISGLTAIARTNVAVNGGTSGTKNKVLGNMGKAELMCLATNWFGLSGDISL